MTAPSLRPLAEMDPGACRALRGVVFDVDDTLTREGRLEEQAFAAMWALHRSGLALMATTGRPLGWCDVFARQWPVIAAVGENGAGWVYRAGHDLRDGYWDDQATRARQRQQLEAISAAAERDIPGLRFASDQRLRRVDLAFDVNEEVHLPADDIRRLVAIIESGGAHALISSVHAHAFVGTHDKGTGAARAVAEVLGEDLGAARERWLFVGDSGNDAAAFAYFPFSAGVANVRPFLSQLPTPPAFVASADRGLGFAEIAAVILQARALSSP